LNAKAYIRLFEQSKSELIKFRKKYTPSESTALPQSFIPLNNSLDILSDTFTQIERTFSNLAKTQKSSMLEQIDNQKCRAVWKIFIK
jgi:hypothetical protein